MSTTHSDLLEASGALRDSAVSLATDRAALKLRGRDGPYRETQEADRLATLLQLRADRLHLLADGFAAADPLAVDAAPHSLLAVQALAADLVFQLGQMQRAPAMMRRATAILPGHALTLVAMTGKVVAYLRVSTDRQAEEGFGLEVQEAAVREWARKTKTKIAFVIRDEGLSGTADAIDRPGLAEAIGHVQAGNAAGIVVPRLDRLARDLVLQEWIRADLIKAGGELRSASAHEDLYLRNDPDDPTGNLVRQILGAVAQYERDMIRLRMAAGKARKREAGGYAGGQPPFGYRAANRDLVPNLDEQRIVQRMRRMRRDGKSLRDIANKLNDDGIASRRGRWHPTTVSRVVDRAS
jgi:DNA invertase Pin-like site-specific DNA recombinase